MILTSWLKYCCKDKRIVPLCFLSDVNTCVLMYMWWISIEFGFAKHPRHTQSLNQIMLCYSSEYSKALLLGKKDLNTYLNIEKSRKCIWSSLLHQQIIIFNLSWRLPILVTLFHDLGKECKKHEPFDRTVICWLI